MSKSLATFTVTSVSGNPNEFYFSGNANADIEKYTSADDLPDPIRCTRDDLLDLRAQIDALLGARDN